MAKEGKADNQQVEDESEEEAPARRQRRAHADSEDAEEYGDEENGEADATPEDQLAKKLVRYVLACEFSRTPIRREGIKERGKENHRLGTASMATDSSASSWRPGKIIQESLRLGAIAAPHSLGYGATRAGG